MLKKRTKVALPHKLRRQRAEDEYVQDDIPCRYGGCANSICAASYRSSSYRAQIPSDVSTVNIMDAHAACDYISLMISHPSLSCGLVLLQSVERQTAKAGSRRQEHQIRDFFLDPKNDCILFDDIHHSAVHQLRKDLTASPNEACRMASAAAQWLASHLSSVNIQILTTSEHVKDYDCITAVFSNLSVNACDDFIRTSSDDTLVLDKLQVLSEAPVDDPDAQAGSVYRPHLSEAVLRAGVKSGLFISGSLFVVR